MGITGYGHTGYPSSYKNLKIITEIKKEKLLDTNNILTELG